MPEAFHIQVSIEAFDDTDDFRMARQIFFDSKPDHYSFSNDTVKLTGAEVIAAYTASMAEAEPNG
jgi:hypothetical protein